MLPEETRQPLLVRAPQRLLALVDDLSHLHFIEFDEGHLIFGAWGVECVNAVQRNEEQEKERK